MLEKLIYKSRNWNWKYVVQSHLGGQLYYSWQLVGKDVAVELHIMEGHSDPYGGIEFHHASPQNGYEHEKPHPQECWLLKRPCWHDGSSLWVSEYWLPYWEECGRNPFSVLNLLIWKMNERFGYTEKEDEAG